MNIVPRTKLSDIIQPDKTGWPSAQIIGIRRVASVLTVFWLVQAAVSALVQIYIASRYGIGSALDVYVTGITIPSIIFMILSTGLGISTVTYFHETRTAKGNDASYQIVIGSCVWALLGGSLLAVALSLAAHQLISLLVPGFSPTALGQAAKILQITAPSLPILVVSSILQGLLQANHRYYSSSAAGIVQIGFVPILLLSGSPPTPEILAWGFNLAVGTSCIILVAAAWRPNLRWIGHFTTTDAKRIAIISLPLIGAAVFTHLVWLSERYFASFLGEGSISALNYGQKILNLVSGVLGFGLSTVLFPTISQHLEDGNRARAGILNKKVLLVLLFFSLASGLILFLEGERIIKFLFERGRFTKISTVMTTTAVKMYIGVLFYNIFGAVLARNAIAAKEGWLVFFTSGLLLIVYISLAPSLIAYHGFAGLPLAASCSFMISLVVYGSVMFLKHPYLYIGSSEPIIRAEITKK
jgi:putative peptidoglycan lipid II flippase